ncbi:MAG: beta-glucosidase [Dysgonamonadaceae bacterium]|nr:beta-glucosidase [Dysgonamonadaceae bacterium]
MKVKFLICVAMYSISCGIINAQNTNKTTIRKGLSDEQLLDLVQKQTFNYFWEGAEPVSGMARERLHIDNIYPQDDKNVITSGGSGFGIMAILAGIERGHITREEGLNRMSRIIGFLEKADHFHGVWPHWWYGETGKVKPFSKKDNGGDLVETSYLLQALLCFHQYYINGNDAEKALAARIDNLWRRAEFDWYRNGQNVLYWHWSPQYNWEMNFPVRGYNECLIMYILAAASPTHGVPAEVYHEGWAESGKLAQSSVVEGIPLQLRQQVQPIGPLFWEHYSFLGLDPRGLKDKYADYWTENKNQTLINRAYCIRNPKNYAGYGENCWGLTSSYSIKGYSGHAPVEQSDLGVIVPTAALSSMPYTPEYSLKVMRHLYENRGDKLWGEYGFYDAFSETENWFPQRYLAIDQGTIPVMIENYRSQLLWKLFMSHPDIQNGLRKLGFESPHLQKQH